MYLVPLNCTNMIKIVCFILCDFYHNKKKFKHFKKATYELIYKIEIELKCRKQTYGYQGIRNEGGIN